MKPKRLKRIQFLEVITNTPLVSIDLVIKDSDNKIWLGHRVNEPAKGKWFVPGGRILKNENLDDAFKRITKEEIGFKYSLKESRFLGAFTHLYDKNVFLVEGISTHYVALAYELQLSNISKVKKMTKQHNDYGWFSIEELCKHKTIKNGTEVHEHVLEYCEIPTLMNEEQYQILNQRRDSFNNLLWQTPVLSLTAQAFLFTIILSDGVSILGRLIAAILALIASFCSLQLLSKHRYMEVQHAKMLHKYEEINKKYLANRKITDVSKWIRISSFSLWKIVLWGFLLASIISLPLMFLGLFTC